MVFELLISFVIIYGIVFYIENFRKKERPPGPIRIPPFGNLIQIGLADTTIYVALHKLARKYGDVMSVKLGLTETVIFSSIEPVKEVFSKIESTGRNRIGFMLERNLGKNIGFAMADGPGYEEARDFCQNSLSKYGFANRGTMTTLFANEVLEFFKVMESDSKLNPILHITSDYFHPVFMNTLMILLRGERYDYGDAQFQNILQHERDQLQNGALGASITMAYPFLKYVIPEYSSQMKGLRGFEMAALNCLNERKMKNCQKNPKSLTDDFLVNMDAGSSNTKRPYTVEHYKVLYADLLQTATDTISNILDFIILHLTVNPAIQEKLFNEISNVIGQGRLPNLGDKSQMQYTQAVILEGHRWSRAGVFGVPRRAISDFMYQNYRIKKGTVMMFNEHSIFFNEEFWRDPHVFRPERFLDSNGNLKKKEADKISIVFSTGRRACFGQVLARDELFIAVTMFFQKFKFALPRGDKPNLEPIMAMSLFAAPYNVILSTRAQYI